MDQSIFDVDDPIVCLEGQGAFWDRQPPAALFVAALCGPGMRVLEVGGDGSLITLAAALGAHAMVLDDTGSAARTARLNAVTVHRERAIPPDLDLLITHDAVQSDDATGVLLCVSAQTATTGRTRIDLVGSEVVVDEPPAVPAPHLLVRSDLVAEVTSRSKEAAYAFGNRASNPWASRVVQLHRSAAQEQALQCAADVKRAYDQMRQARDELRAVRRSRSWRYTQFLRRV